MSELRNLTLLSPGPRIVVSYPCGEEKCWVSFLWWFKVGLCNDTVQSDYPRNVVKLEQIMDAPSDDAIWTLAL